MGIDLKTIFDVGNEDDDSSYILLPDMREKVKEYIRELEEEIRRCTDEQNKIIGIEATYMAVRIETLLQVVNDLKNRLEELL